MHHTIAFFESTDATANVDVQPVTDDVIGISNNHFMPSADLDLVYAFVSGLTLDRARLVNPSMRQISPIFIRPINLVTGMQDDANVADYRANPFRIRGLEELALESTQTAAGPTGVYALLGLQSTFEPMPRGQVYTMRGTSTTASVAATWTTIVTTWADTLPDGLYAVVGAEVWGATEIGFRLIFDNQIWRPGGLAQILATNKSWAGQLKGGLGVWGRFRPTALPQVQVLNSAAVAAHTVYLDLMRVA